jgi:hypothetical protein
MAQVITTTIPLALNRFDVTIGVELRSQFEHPDSRLASVAFGIDAAKKGLEDLIENIVSSYGETQRTPAELKAEVERIFKTDPDQVAIDMGGDFILFGDDLEPKQVWESMGTEDIGPDAAFTVRGLPDAVLGFFATNNAGGPTFVMRRKVFVELYPKEVIAE